MRIFCFFIHYWFLFYLDCALQTNFVWFLFFWYYCILWHRTWSRFVIVSHELEDNIYLSPATTTYTKDVSEWFKWQCSLDLLYTSDCLWDSNGDIKMFNHSLSFSSARFYPWNFFYYHHLYTYLKLINFNVSPLRQSLSFLLIQACSTSLTLI